MMSWIYLLSFFTPEALFIEALLIFSLCCSYLVFWVLKKRRFGILDQDIPSGPVKMYLNELIFRSEQIKTQLFGILSSSPVQKPSPFIPAPLGDPPVAQTPSNETILANNLEVQQKIDRLNATLNELQAEKGALFKELEKVRVQLASQTEGKGEPESLKVISLTQKLTELQAQLAEYSIIEDDLASLKKLRQENDLLKQELAKNEAATAALLSTEGTPAQKTRTLKDLSFSPQPLSENRTSSEPPLRSEGGGDPPQKDQSTQVPPSQLDLSLMTDSTLAELENLMTQPLSDPGKNADPADREVLEKLMKG